jgi:hypothetical protein
MSFQIVNVAMYLAAVSVIAYKINEHKNDENKTNLFMYITLLLTTSILFYLVTSYSPVVFTKNALEEESFDMLFTPLKI